MEPLPSIALYASSYLDLVVSLWPNIVPRALTIWEAAAPPTSQLFALVGFVIVIPFIFAHAAVNQRLFRGKVCDSERYS